MFKIYCDGGARGNPGPAAFGFIVHSNEKIVHKGKGYLGIATNNFAEYTAVIEALKWLQKSPEHKNHDLNFYLDSQLVVSQLSGIFKVKNAKLRNLVFEVKTLETNFGQIRYNYIPRIQNQLADSLVNEALDEQHGI
jgi:ribonuclease HI